jgi:hypothetical protein
VEDERRRRKEDSGLAHTLSKERLTRVLLERLGTPIISLKRADLPVPGHVHDAENVGSMMQSGRDKARAQAVSREESWIKSGCLCPSFHNLSDRSI